MRISCVVLVGAVLFSACGSSSSTTTPSPITLLDVTAAFVAGQNCNVAGISKDFNGTANTRITITTTATGLNMGVTLYAPDFATQLAGTTGVGTATINTTLTQTGTHHVSYCEINGVAGSVRLLVTQNP